MTQRKLLGEFELLVLLAVLQTRDAAYGVSIAAALDDRIGRRVSRGSLYLTLERLVQKGYLRAWHADPTPERGGHARKYYRVEKAGLAAIRESRHAVRRMWRGLEATLGEP